MKTNLSDITVVLDRSGSMSTVADDTIGGFNTFLDEQKAAPGEANFTLVQFDTEYEFVHKGRSVRDVPALTRQTFQPRGGTALLDAIGRAVQETGSRLDAMPESDRPAHVIFVILTDGQENSSKEYTREKVFGIIDHQRTAYSWTFLFLGANQDAIQAGAGLGIPMANAMNYAANAVGTPKAFAATNKAVLRARTGQSAHYSQSDRDEQDNAGAWKAQK
jgi:hypothetical protein